MNNLNSQDTGTTRKVATGLVVGGGVFAAFGLAGYFSAKHVSKALSVVGSRKSLVRHTLREVPYIDPKTRKPKIDKKTKKIMVRKEVVESPAELAIQASKKLGRDKFITLTPYTLATVMASEAGSGQPAAKAAIAWAIKNAARAKGVNVFRLVAPDGKFGGQLGRYCASGQPPSEIDLNIAEAIEAGKIPDMTRGAVQWDSPNAQDALVKRGQAGYNKTAAMVAAARVRDGKEVVHLPGVDPGYLRLWRPRTAMAGGLIVWGDDFLRAVAA